MKKSFMLNLFATIYFGCIAQKNSSKVGTSFINPAMWADVPDMSITRTDKDFYLISSTMYLMPAAPVMKSQDLVRWEIAGYVFDSLSDNSKYNLIDGNSLWPDVCVFGNRFA